MDYIRKEKITKLREKGLTYREIGKILGISWQRVWQINTDYKSSSKNKNLKVDEDDVFEFIYHLDSDKVRLRKK